MVGRSDYYERIEAKRERLEERAERLAAQAASDFRKADLREEVSGIPFGQPVLVGHHSERRHRNAIEKANRALDRAISTDKAARETAARVETYGTHGISSDAPDAIDLLREKMAKLEERQSMMRAANKAVREALKWKVEPFNDTTSQNFTLRVAKGKGNSQATVWGHYREDQREVAESAMRKAQVEEFKGLGLPEAAIFELLKPDFCGRIGFADYQLSNNNANIKRTKDRIAALERSEQRETKEVLHNSGVRFVQNVEENRVQLVFPGKPDAETRSKLKSAGFRWSPTAGAWQRMLNNAGIWAGQRVLESLIEGE